MENSHINPDISALIQIMKLLYKVKYNRQMFDVWLKTCEKNVNIKLYPHCVGYPSRKDEIFIVE